MIVIFEQVAMLLLFGAAGYLLAKTKIVDSSQTTILSRLCLNLFLPAKIFNTFASQFTPQYLQQNYPLLLSSAVIVGGLALLSIPVCRLLTKHSYQQKVYHYCLTIPNYGYIGYALAEGAFGGAVLMDVMVFTMPMSIYTYTIGYCLLTNTKVSLRRLLNPITITMVLGAAFGLLGIPVPALAGEFLSKSAGCLAVTSMVLTGMVISDYAIKDMVLRWQVYAVGALRLLVIPLVFCFGLKLLGLDTLVLPAALMLAMPCGMNTVIFPKAVGEDCKPGAALAFVTSILCCLTVPLCLYCLGLM